MWFGCQVLQNSQDFESNITPLVKSFQYSNCFITEMILDLALIYETFVNATLPLPTCFMFLLLPLSTFSTQQDNPKRGPFKCHQVCKAWKALPVNIKQNHCRFHGITFLHCKESWEDRKGSFWVGVWMRTLCECEWKLYVLCYFNRLCLFALKETVLEKIGLSSFYFISMLLCTFTKINLLSHVINSCFTIVPVHIIPP